MGRLKDFALVVLAGTVVTVGMHYYNKHQATKKAEAEWERHRTTILGFASHFAPKNVSTFEKVLNESHNKYRQDYVDSTFVPDYKTYERGVFDTMIKSFRNMGLRDAADRMELFISITNPTIRSPGDPFLDDLLEELEREKAGTRPETAKTLDEVFQEENRKVQTQPTSRPKFP
jgi:hypothetical protein